MIVTKENYEPLELAVKLYEVAEKSYLHGSPWNQKQFQEDLVNPYSQYLIWLEETKIIGFIAFHQIFDEIEVMHVVVLPAYQGRKIGYALLGQLNQQAKKAEIRQIFLEVRQSNKVARHLYEKSGFEVIGERENYYQNPVEKAILMVKKR